MERFTLILLVACALIAVGLAEGPPPDDANTPSAHAVTTTTPSNRPGPAVPAETSASELEGVEQILRRFALRHTALAERERVRLAHAIVAEARVHDLDPDLVMAVIEVESAGYHLAVSPVGALGLMQLLPTTGRELADKLGIEWRGPDTLFDPIVNVRLGTAYLRQLADRYGGDVNMALAAYNWGPGRIDRRLRRGAIVPSRYVDQVRRAADRYADADTGAARS